MKKTKTLRLKLYYQYLFKLQMQIESEHAHLKEDQLSYRYALNNDPNSAQHGSNSLCEHHRKKLSDLFLIRHLTGTFHIKRIFGCNFLL